MYDYYNYPQMFDEPSENKEQESSGASDRQGISYLHVTVHRGPTGGQKNKNILL